MPSPGVPNELRWAPSSRPVETLAKPPKTAPEMHATEALQGHEALAGPMRGCLERSQAPRARRCAVNNFELTFTFESVRQACAR